MKVILFGATGTAGGSVLRACVDEPVVQEVRVVARRTPKQSHPKIKYFNHADFLNYSSIKDAFKNVDACFFCLGISVNQVSGESEYRRITHDFAIAAAQILKIECPSAVFHYLSGHASFLNQSSMWARVKYETESDLLAFTDAVCWRPGFINGEPSDNGFWFYKFLRPAASLFRWSHRFYVDGIDIGQAMIKATAENIRARRISNAEIRSMAEESRRRPISTAGRQ